MNIKVLVYNEDLKIYKTEWTLDLAAVPQVGNKIVHTPQENGPAFVYDIDEVRLGDRGLVDVLVHVVSDLTDYNSRRVSTQNFQ